MLSRDDLRKAFDEADTNKSGAIDLQELVALSAKLGQPSDLATVSKLFEEIDTNHDGNVSYEEFVAWWRLGKYSKLKQVMKASLQATSWYNSNLKGKFLDKKIGDDTDIHDLFNMEVSQGEPQDESHFHLHVTSNADESLTDMIKAAHPDIWAEAEDPSRRALLCFVQESKNANAYAEAWRTAMDAFGDMLAEAVPDFADLVDMVKPAVGNSDTHLIVVSNLAMNPVAGPYVEMALGMMQQFPVDALGVAADLKFFSGGDHKDWTTNPDWTNKNADGSGMLVNVACTESGKIFAETMLDEMVPPEATGCDQITASDLLKTFNGVSIRLKTNPASQGGNAHESAKKLQEFFNQQVAPQLQLPQQNLPNTEDFKNWESVKPKLEEMVAPHREMMKAYVDCPALNDLLNAMREHGLANFRFVELVGPVQAGLRLKTTGLVQCFDAAWDLVKGE